jgi:hypothetical protein
LDKNQVIRSFFAGVLLIIFTFSITPKNILHHIIASHQDDICLITNHDITNVHQAGFHCSCENLVAESPFISCVSFQGLKAPVIFSVFAGGIVYDFYNLHHFFAELRGPPPFVD